MNPRLEKAMQGSRQHTWLTAKQLAEKEGVTKMTICNMLNEGVIFPAFQVGVQKQWRIYFAYIMTRPPYPGVGGRPKGVKDSMKFKIRGRPRTRPRKRRRPVT